MSWDRFYRRRDAINTVLAAAKRNPEAGLPFEELPEVTEVFDSREELALALQYKWSQLLSGRINLALSDAEQGAEVDHVEAVSAAWRATAIGHPALRRVLDDYAIEGGPKFQAGLRGEQCMLALAAGLANSAESTQEINRIGEAFLRLIRSTPEQAVPRRRSPVEQLLRKLAATSS
ncbi:MAG TPA: hypothetical protein VG317_13240 [Pseudonocardiaceae bacterium]|jgi:hypothetical protein|nr:hypothetical protein [Pseudonocardiaceae bacterium]